MIKKIKKGFTLVELVIVMAVIAILAAVLIPSFISVIKNARESTDVQLARNMTNELAAYKYDKNGNLRVMSAADVRTYLDMNELAPSNEEGKSFWLNLSTYEITLKQADELTPVVSAAETHGGILYLEEIIPGYLLLDNQVSMLGTTINAIKNLSRTDKTQIDEKFNSIVSTLKGYKNSNTYTEKLGMTKAQCESMISHIEQFSPQVTIYVDVFGYTTSWNQLSSAINNSENGTISEYFVENIVFADGIKEMPTFNNTDFGFSIDSETKTKLAVGNTIVLPKSLEFVYQNNLLGYIDKAQGVDTNLVYLNDNLKTAGNPQVEVNNLFSSYLMNKYTVLKGLDVNAREQSLAQCSFEVSTNDAKLKEDENGDKYSEVSLKILIPTLYRKTLENATYVYHEGTNPPEGYDYLMNDGIISQSYRYTNLSDEGRTRVDVRIYDDKGILFTGTQTYKAEIKINSLEFTGNEVIQFPVLSTTTESGSDISNVDMPLNQNQELIYKLYYFDKNANNGEGEYKPLEELTEENFNAKNTKANYYLPSEDSTEDRKTELVNYMLNLIKGKEYILYTNDNTKYCKYDTSLSQYQWYNSTNAKINGEVMPTSQDFDWNNYYVYKAVETSINDSGKTYKFGNGSVKYPINEVVYDSEKYFLTSLPESYGEYAGLCLGVETYCGVISTNESKSSDGIVTVRALETHTSENKFVRPKNVSSIYLMQNINEINNEVYNTLGIKLELCVRTDNNPLTDKILATKQNTFGNASQGIKKEYLEVINVNKEDNEHEKRVTRYEYSYSFRDPIYYTDAGYESFAFTDKDVTSYKETSRTTNQVVYEVSISGENKQGLKTFRADDAGTMIAGTDKYYEETFNIIYTKTLQGGIRIEIKGLSTYQNLVPEYSDYPSKSYRTRIPYIYSIDKEELGEIKTEIDTVDPTKTNTLISLIKYNGNTVTSEPDTVDGDIIIKNYSTTMSNSEAFNPTTTKFRITTADNITRDYSAGMFENSKIEFKEDVDGTLKDKVIHTFIINANLKIVVQYYLEDLIVNFNFVYDDIASSYTMITELDESPITISNTDLVETSRECFFNEEVTLSTDVQDETQEYSFVAWYFTNANGKKVLISTKPNVTYKIKGKGTISCEYATNALYEDTLMFEYTDSNKTCLISACNNKDITKLYIPSYSGDYAVTSIKEKTFLGCLNLETVSIPETVITIGSQAFSGTKFENNNLSYVGNYLYKYTGTDTNYTVRDNTTTIGNSAFMDNTTLESVTLPDSIVIIDDYAFSKMQRLKYIYISENSQLTTIKTYAFSNCLNFKGFRKVGTETYFYPSSLTSVGDYAFSMCKSLESFEFENIEKIGSYCFQYCVRLPKAILTNEKLVTIPASCFSYCSSLAEVTLGEKITTLSSNCFDNCSSLVSIILPNVTTFDSNIFMNCVSLTSITMPEKTKIITSGLFSGCSSLTEIKVKVVTVVNKQNVISYEDLDFTDLTTINTSAFQNCNSFPFGDLIVSNNLITDFTIGNSAFYGCTNLTSIEFEGSWKTPELTATYLFYDCKNLTSVNMNGATSIGAYSFQNCESLVTISGLSLSTIPAGLFYGCANLTTNLLNNSITNISNQAFYGCAKIPFGNLVIGEKQTNSLGETTYVTELVSLGYYSFYNCDKLTGITINAENFSTGYDYTTYSISSCPNLRYIVINANNIDFRSRYYTYTYAFANNTNLERVELNAYAVTFTQNTTKNDGRIPGYTFNGCSNLREIVLPFNTVTIDATVFNGCTKLMNITKYTDYTWKLSNLSKEYSISNKTFANSKFGLSNNNYLALTDDFLLNTNTKTIYSYVGTKGTTTNITTPATYTTINQYAFANSKVIKNLIVNSNVTNIGSYAFKDSKFESITLTSQITIEANAFSGCDATIYVASETLYNYYKTNTALSGLSIIYNGEFEETDVTLNIVDGTLNSVTGNPITLVLDETVTAISANAFKDKTTLISITMPNVISIGSQAFKGCSNLKTVNMDKVSTIGANAFENCSKLEIVLSSVITNIGEKAFYNNTTTTQISLGNYKVTIGNYAFNADSTHTTDLKIASIFSWAEYESTLPVISTNSFNFTKITSISVLQQSITYFSRANVWKNYSSIIKPIGFEVEGNVLTKCNDTRANIDLSSRTDITSIANEAFKGLTSMKTLILPKTIATIGQSAFEGCTGLTTISFQGESGDVTIIGQNAFKGATKLTTINGLDFTKVTTFGNSAFENCSVLSFNNTNILSINPSFMGTSVFKNCKKLQKLTLTSLPENTTKLPDNFVYGCANLTEFNLPANTITSVGANTFYGCAKLEKILTFNILNMTEIGANAFYGCQVYNFGKLTFTNTVMKNIGASAFYNCKKITSLVVSSDATENVTISNNLFFGCTGLTSVTLNNKVTAIGTSSFSGCSNLAKFNTTTDKNMLISSNIKTVGQTAFKGCSLITKITIDSENCNIKANAFDTMTKVANIEFKQPGTILGNKTFNGCSGLTKIIFKNIASVGENIFSSCENLKEIDMGETTNIANNCFKDSSHLEKITAFSVTQIGNSAFENCKNLKDVIIDFTKLTSIGEKAFQNCSNVVFAVYSSITTKTNATELVIGSADNEIILGNYAFDNTFKTPQTINTITFAGTLSNNKVSDYAFRNANQITNVKFDKLVNKIGISAFDNCTNLLTLSGDGMVSANIVEFGNYAFKQCALLNLADPNTNTLTINSDATLGIGVFQNNTSLKNVVINANLTTIPSRLFYYCVNLENLTLKLDNQITNVGTYAFNNCINLKTLNNFDISKVTYIGTYAFNNCKKLEWNSNVVIGEDVETLVIENYAFQNNMKLKKVSIKSQYLKSLVTTDTNYNNSLGDYIFYGCLDLEEVILPATITKMYFYTFTNCVNLVSIKTSETEHFDISNLTYMGSSLFNNCISLKLNDNGIVNIKATTLSAYIFKNNFGLKQVTFDDECTMTNIPACIFQNCVYLEKVLIKDTFTTINKQAFDGCTSLEGIYHIAIVEEQPVEEKYDFSLVTSIVSYAFGNCYSLSNDINLNSVKSLGAYSFQNCRTINKVSNIGNTNLNTIDSYTFSGCENLETVTFNENESTNSSYIKNIKIYAFNGCIKLDISSDQISNFVTIDKYSFYNCQSLKAVKFNSNLTVIGDNAFAYCSSLSKVEFEDSSKCVTIGASAFFGSLKLRDVTIPASVTTIGDKAFYRCTILNAIFIERNSTNKLSIGTDMKSNLIFANDTYKNYYAINNDTKAYVYYMISLTDIDSNLLEKGIILNKKNGTMLKYDGTYENVTINKNSIILDDDTINLDYDIKAISSYCFAYTSGLTLDISSEISQYKNCKYKIS